MVGSGSLDYHLQSKILFVNLRYITLKKLNGKIKFINDFNKENAHGWICSAGHQRIKFHNKWFISLFNQPKKVLNISSISYAILQNTNLESYKI